MSSPPLWKEPQQARSRERFDRMLAAADRELAEDGAEFSLTRVAERAQVPIGSLYQFFSGREGLLAALMDRRNRAVEALVREHYAGVHSLDAFVRASRGMVEAFYRAFRSDEGRLALRRAFMSSPTLRELDLAASKRNADLLFDALSRCIDGTPSEALRTACFMLCDQAGSVCETALALPDDEGHRLVRAFEDMALGYVRGLG